MLGPIRWLSPEEQSAWAATLQTIGLLGTLLFAAETLYSDQRDRRVDRVLAFHEELTAGPTGEARARLARFLREQGEPDGAVLQVSRQQLIDDPKVQKYSANSDAGASTPHVDLTLILRLFERVRIAHAAESLDEHLLASLIGRHAGWWDLAIAEDDQDTLRIPLKKLGAWSNTYRDAHKDQPGFENWGQSRNEAFPRGHIRAAPKAANSSPGQN
jgi:hypothetical protein